MRRREGRGQPDLLTSCIVRNLRLTNSLARNARLPPPREERSSAAHVNRLGQCVGTGSRCQSAGWSSGIAAGVAATTHIQMTLIAPSAAAVAAGLVRIAPASRKWSLGQTRSAAAGWEPSCGRHLRQYRAQRTRGPTRVAPRVCRSSARSYIPFIHAAQTGRPIAGSGTCGRSAQRPAVPRSSERPAARRDHWAVGRPLVR
jgi:hypothetical protein